MIVTIKLLLTDINSSLKWFNFLFIDCSFHQFHVFEFDLVGIVDFFKDELTPNEGERNCGNKSNNSSPNNHGRTKKLISKDRGNEYSLKSPVDKQSSGSRQSSKVLLMSKIKDRIPRNACPFVILEMFIVNFEICAL